MTSAVGPVVEPLTAGLLLNVGLAWPEPDRPGGFSSAHVTQTGPLSLVQLPRGFTLIG